MEEGRVTGDGEGRDDRGPCGFPLWFDFDSERERV